MKSRLSTTIQVFLVVLLTGAMLIAGRMPVGSEEPVSTLESEEPVDIPEPGAPVEDTETIPVTTIVTAPDAEESADDETDPGPDPVAETESGLLAEETDDATSATPTDPPMAASSPPIEQESSEFATSTPTTASPRQGQPAGAEVRVEFPNDESVAPAPQSATPAVAVTPEIKAVVSRLAPVLAFDSAQEDYPMDAQIFFDHMLSETKDPGAGTITWAGHQAEPSDPGARKVWSSRAVGVFREDYWVVTNTDRSSMNFGSVPTYFKVIEHPVTGALRIQYWWFYGWQPPCNTTAVSKPGSHMGDWENVIITTTPDRKAIETVTFAQHGGWYTRQGPWFETDGDGRPVVYVGKDSHGSYHYGNSGWWGHSCIYFDDPRDPRGAVPTVPPESGVASDYWWTSTGPLLSLTGDAQPWMAADRIDTTYPGTNLTINSWRWGPTIRYRVIYGIFPSESRYEAGVGTHPTTRGLEWSLAFCKNQSGPGNGCDKNEGSWPSWIETPGFAAFITSGTASAGGPLNVDVALRSIGFTAAHDVVVVAALPAGMDWAIDPATSGCSIVDGVLRCELQELPAQEELVVQLIGQTQAQSCGDGEISAQATGSDAWESPVSATATTSVMCPAPDLVLSTIAAGDTCPGVPGTALAIEEGSQVEYCYAATNSGTEALVGATLTDDNATPDDPSDDVVVPLSDLASGDLLPGVTATARTGPFTLDAGNWTRQATLAGTSVGGAMFSATGQAAVEASDVTPAITVSLKASADQVTVSDEVTYTLEVENASVEAVTLAAIEDVVDGTRKVDLTDPSDDAVKKSTCAPDVTLEAGDTYQCTFTRTLDTVGTARDLVLVVAADNEASQADGSAAVAVTVVAPEVGPPLRPEVRSKTQTPTPSTTSTGVLSATGASIAGLVLLATALIVLGGTFVAAGRKGAHRRT